MKKLITILALLAFTAVTYGQKTNTRNYYTGDNTWSVIPIKSVAVSDTDGATVDTVELRPAAGVTYYTATISDSATLRLKSTAACYKGDRIVLDVINAGPTSFFYLAGNWIVSTGTAKITNTTAKRSHLEWYFDGKNFVETSRNLNYTY